MNSPKSVKKERKLEKKQPLSSDHWFGILPFAIKTYLTKRKKQVPYE